MTPHDVAEYSMCILLVAGPLGLIWHYATRERKPGEPFGIGWRAIQIIAVVILAPLAGILAMEKLLDSEATGTLIGALAGYALSPRDKG